MDTIAKARIMAVDDAEVNLELLKALLEEQYEVATAGSAEDCLEQLSGGFLPDVFLLDICMPDRDGYELCAQLKADSRWRHIPVMFVSALERAEDRLRAYEVGGEDYIIKPIQADQVLEKVARMLEAGQVLRELQARSQQASGAAMEAMMSSCEMGQLIDFMLKSATVNAASGLMEAARQLLEQWGLASAMYYCNQKERFFCGVEEGVLEARILADSRGEGVSEFRQRLLLDRGDFRVLIKNMPLEQPERCGRLKDNLSVLCNIIRVRLQTLRLEHDMKQQRDEILEQVIKKSETQLDAVRQKVRAQSQASVDAFRLMLQRLEDKMFYLGLEEDQEKALRSLVDEAGGTVTELVHVADEVQSSVDNVMHDLYLLAQRD